MGDRCKTFLYGWLGQWKIFPNYETRSVGTQLAPQFVCELSVKGYDDIVTAGTGQTKKQAQSAAAREFLRYLVKKGEISEKELPEPLPPSDESSHIRQRSKRKSSESSVDTKDSTRLGYWNLKNAKGGLHQFMQQKNLQQDYRVSCVEKGDTRKFIVELDLFLPMLRKTLKGKAENVSKQEASRMCALVIVRQLYNLGLLEAYKAPTLKRETAENLTVYNVIVDSSLEHTLYKSIQEMSADIPRKPSLRNDRVTLLLEDSAVVNAKMEEDNFVVSWIGPKLLENPWSNNVMQTELSAHILQERQTLPVFESREIINYAVNSNKVVIVRGFSGSGLTTQVPQYILDDFIQRKKGTECSILVIEPHDVSAILAAECIAKERAEKVGESCGYVTTHEAALPRPKRSITFCTTDVLFQRMESGLQNVSHIVVDEVHERELEIDVLLSILRGMVEKFPRLRLVLLIATVDTTAFSKYFDNCPLVEVICQSYSVREYFLEDCVEFLNFMPIEHVSKKKKDKSPTIILDGKPDNLNTIIGAEYVDATRVAMSLMNETEIPYELIQALLVYIHKLNIAGSVLVFLPGLNVIFKLLDKVKSNTTFDPSLYVFHPLHHLMSAADLEKVLEPVAKGVTKVILMTNVAQSCLSISDVVFVINSCKTNMELVKNNRAVYGTVWISRMTMNQRKERAGLVRPGFCFHLCSRARFADMRATRPQTEFSPLTSVILKLKLLGYQNMQEFFMKVVDPPPTSSITRAESELRAIGFQDSDNNLNSLGKAVAKLAIAPSLGKMVLVGCMFGCGDAMCTLAAQSTIFTDPFTSSEKKKTVAAPMLHSDHLALLQVFQDWENVVCFEEDEIDFCKKNHLIHSLMCSIWLVKEQLKTKVRLIGIPETSITPLKMKFDGNDKKVDLATALLCVGYYPNICQHIEKSKVTTIDKGFALISPASLNFSYSSLTFPYPFLVFGEQVATSSFMCKHTSVVSPIHLILFGSRRLDYVDGTVIIDDVWQLKTNFKFAATLVALRTSIKTLLHRFVKECTTVEQMRYDRDALQLFENSLFEGGIKFTSSELSVLEITGQLCTRHLSAKSRKRMSVRCIPVSTKERQESHSREAPIHWNRSQQSLPHTATSSSSGSF